MGFCAEDIWHECEEGELHRQSVAMRGHQIRFKRAQSVFVHLASADVKCSIPTTICSQYVHTNGVDLCISRSIIWIWALKVEPLHIARHIGGAENELRLPSKRKLSYPQ